MGTIRGLQDFLQATMLHHAPTAPTPRPSAAAMFSLNSFDSRVGVTAAIETPTAQAHRSAIMKSKSFGATLSPTMKIQFGTASKASPLHANQDRRVAIVDAQEIPHIKTQLRSAFPGQRVSFFAVYDGHGSTGGFQSDFAKNNLHNILFEKLEQYNETQRDIETAIYQAVKEVDRRLIKVPAGGTCALFALLIDDMLYVANIGDCRAVYMDTPRAHALGLQQQQQQQSQGGMEKDKERILNLSRDHKAVSPRERSRIENHNGTVTSAGRIMGLLPSRTLGDRDAKLEGQHKLVISDPEITTMRINPTGVLILATDGVFDVMDSKDVATYVRNLKGKEPLQTVAEQLVQHCAELGSEDDISVVVVSFG